MSQKMDSHEAALSTGDQPRDKCEHKDEDVVLNVESSEVDCLYRIARYTTSDTDTIKRVVYVTVCDASIIPADERTWSYSILKNLSKLEGWTDRTWHTMHVFLTSTGIGTALDRELPHTLSNDNLLAHLPCYNALDVDVDGIRIKPGVARGWIDGQDVFFKFAIFPYLLGYLRRELLMYQHLLCENVTCAPRLLGYVYEETPDRVIGFVCQAIQGRHALPSDYDRVLAAIQRLHAQGIHHGDVNRYNILITPQGEVIFIDFENSTLVATSALSDTEIAVMMQAEENGLFDSLADESILGKPWNT